jgi:predicted phosphodiesterase
MRVAALYDIHGNLAALDAVLDDVRRAGVDRIVVGGDVVPGPMAFEALERLRAVDLPVDCITGNGDREVLAHRAGLENSTLPAQVREALRWSAGQLDDELARWMAGWPATLRLSLPELGDVLFCHATPRSDTEIVTRLTRDTHVAAILEGADASLVVCGHTHMQFDRRIGRTRLVNAGSVGMPFGVPGAFWLLLGPQVELRHTSYDLAAAAERIRATDYPDASDFAERHVLHPMTEEAMLELLATADSR